MRGKNAKLLRKVFTERPSYKRAKRAYKRSTIRERLKAKEDLQDILDKKRGNL